MRQHIIDSTLAAAPQAAPVVPKEMTAGIAVKHWEGGRGSIESFVAGYNFCRAAMFHASPVCTYPSGDGSLRWPCPVHPGNYPVIPDGYVMVPKVPSQAHLNSIAMRYRHDFYLLNDAQKDSALATARQMYEECSGQGFYTLPAVPQEVR